jgi:hypothetical protein
VRLVRNAGIRMDGLWSCTPQDVAMPMLLIAGQFPILNTQPGGDSVPRPLDRHPRLSSHRRQCLRPQTQIQAQAPARRSHLCRSLSRHSRDTGHAHPYLGAGGPTLRCLGCSKSAMTVLASVELTFLEGVESVW